MDNKTKNSYKTDENVSNPSLPSESSRKIFDINKLEGKRSKILLATLLIIVSLIFLFLIINRDKEGVILKDDELKEMALDLPGKIYLTLSPITTERPLLGIYEYDLSSEELNLYFEFEEDIDNLTGSFSSDGSQMIFVRRYPDYTSQVLSLDVESKDLIEISPRYGFLERNPIFSPDNSKAVYWYYENPELPFSSAPTPEDNFIIMSTVGDPFLIERIKGYGAFPRFSPDGAYLIYLKNDGLYTLNLESDEEILALELDLEFDSMHDEINVDWLSIRFNISPDGSHLLVTDSLNAQMSLFQLTSWSPFSYDIVFEDLFAGSPMWPVFSPCGEFFVIQEGAEVSIFNLEGSKVKSLFGLGDYIFESIWITDWIVE